LTQVDHPNIVKLFEVFDDDDNYHLVMELMTGGEVMLLKLFFILLSAL
jgi:serine/threonine protein kinase